MANSLDRTVSVVLIIATVTIAASVVYRTFAPPRARAATLTPPTFVKSWQDVLPVGRTIAGTEDASTVIVEYTDLECPSCRAMQPILNEVLAAHPNDVCLVYVAFPLRMHRFAMSAAKGAACIESSENLRRWIGSIYEKQDSLGIKSWGSFAAAAGIKDTQAIAKCSTSASPIARIDSSIKIGEGFGVNATPTVVIGGWMFSTFPSKTVIEEAIVAVKSGRAPNGGK